MKAFISTVLLVASAAQGTRAAPANATATNTRGFFGANPPLGGYNNGLVGGQNQGFGGINSAFGGTNQGFGGINSAFGGTNQGFGGINSNVGGGNQGLGGFNSVFSGGNQGFGGFNPVVGGVNPGFGGVSPVVAGVNPGYGGANPIIGGVNSGFSGVSPVVGGGVVPASGSVCQFWCNRGGRYVCCENSQQAHPGRCPVPRPQCPPVRAGFQGPQHCNLDIDCPFQNKCCYDTCLSERVCKPALYY